MGKRRQHTIPSFYLKKFLEPGVLYRRGDRSPRHVKTPKDVAVHRDYYGRSSDRFNGLDKINDMTETWAAPLLEKLIDDVSSITYSEWVILSYYFANIYVRTPAFQGTMINTFKEMTEQLNKMAERMKKAYEEAEAEGKDLSLFSTPAFNNSPGTSADEWNKWMDKLDREDGKLDNISLFYSLIRDIAECIQKMAFYIFEAPAGLFFITTDRPLVLFSLISGSPYGAGWGRKDALAVLALDPEHLLTMCYRGEPAVYHRVPTVEDVRFFNVELMKYAVNEVYSRYTYDIALDWMLRSYGPEAEFPA
jgi:hypothetical protein